MKTAGITDFYNIFPDLKNVKLDLENIKNVEVEEKDTPKPRKKNIYVSSGPYGVRYSNKSQSELMEDLRKMLKSVEANAREPEWHHLTETLVCDKSLLENHMIDIKV
ncbi:MAG: hypothetical protein FH762_06025 [Firmicutes bacterium]|nr:hypothetical protein [Bacillota bacterium]